MSQFRRAGRSGHVIDNAPLTGGAFSIPKLIRVAGKDKLSGPYAWFAHKSDSFIYFFIRGIQAIRILQEFVLPSRSEVCTNFATCSEAAGDDVKNANVQANKRSVTV
jgi:hypothetical protein